MAFFVWANLLMSLKNHSPRSAFFFFLLTAFDEHSRSHSSELRQFRVFDELLRLVPGLKDRIVDGTPDDIVEISDLVCQPLIDFYMSLIAHADPEGRSQCQIG